MSYEAVVYFAGPRTQWLSKVQDEDVLFRRSYRWRWLAHWMARSVYGQLDPARCGYVVLDEDGETLEHIQYGAL